MKKVLFIVPHLSTGGMPQYTYNLISKIINDVDVYCIEYTLLAWNYVVQRNRIKSLLGDKFYAEFQNKSEILDIINKINPDLIHFQELPEYFMDDEISRKIYKKDRPYIIVETSHDSSFDVESKRFYPDHFALISNYQKQNFLKLDIPISIVESDIEYKPRKDRELGLKELGLDPNIKHVLNVGLFTSRKNQKEIFEYAKKLIDEPIQFHFVGNMAENFKDYWGPLVANTTPNIKLWGERNDVDNFYSCMDLFLFTSRGNDNDKETSPLVIREAIGYNIPSLIYNLPVYMGMYDKYENVSYLRYNDHTYNTNKILHSLGLNETDTLPNNLDKSDIAVSISTYTNSDYIVDQTIQCINALKRHTNYSIICTDHKPAPKKLVEMCDHYFYDSNNVMTEHTYFNTAWGSTDQFKYKLNLSHSKNNKYHGAAVHQNIFSGVLLADALKYKYVICMNFDFIPNKYDVSLINDCISRLEAENKEAFFLFTPNWMEGSILRTVFFITKPKFYLDRFENIINKSDYENLTLKYNTNTNGLENIYFHILKNDLDKMIIEYKTELEFFNSSYKNNSGNDKSFTSSQTEYSSIVEIKNRKNENNFMLLYTTPNSLESAYRWEIYSNDSLIFEHIIPINIKNTTNSNNNNLFINTKEIKLYEDRKYDIFLKNHETGKIIKEFINVDIDAVKQQGTFEWII
jgi:hypothetical protein